MSTQVKQNKNTTTVKRNREEVNNLDYIFILHKYTLILFFI